MRAKRITLWFVLAAALGLSWLYFAPTQLGGSTLYTATAGTSMEPLFHKGDLALVRPAASYRVGQVVLYDSPVVHRPVLHRIKVIQDGRFYFQGDNNDFVDPGYATRAELLGSLWFRVPHGGSVVNWIAEPMHASLFAGASVIFLLLGGATTAKRRRRAPTARAPEPREARSRPSLLRKLWHRPRQSPLFVGGVAALLLGAVLLVLGLTSPVKRAVEVPGVYSNTGTFSYSARADNKDATYPTGMARTGDPIFLAHFKQVSLSFRYRLATGAAHQVHGTIALKVFVSSDSTWHTLATLVAPTRFVGDTAVARGTFDLAALKTLLAQLAVDSGSVGASYTVDIKPVVHVVGRVAGKPIDETFSPVLPASVTQTLLKVTASAPVAPAGATYAPPSRAEVLAAAFNPVAPGTVPGIAPNFVTVARYHLPVSVSRGLGLGLAVIGLLALLSEQLRSRRDVWAADRRIAFRHGCALVDVLSLGAGEAEATVLPDLENLAGLAEACERPILRRASAEGPVYAVEESGRLYLYRAPAEPTSIVRPGPAAPAEPVAPPAASPPAARLRRVMRPAGLIVMLAVAAGVVTSFTAANSVPASRAGSSLNPRQIAQLAPSQCAGIGLTNLIVATGSSVSGTSGNDLIIGRNTKGTMTYAGGGGNDCIVAGGDSASVNAIDGGTGADVCIGGPGARKNTFSTCESTY